MCTTPRRSKMAGNGGGKEHASDANQQPVCSCSVVCVCVCACMCARVSVCICAIRILHVECLTQQTYCSEFTKEWSVVLIVIKAGLEDANTVGEFTCSVQCVWPSSSVLLPVPPTCPTHWVTILHVFVQSCPYLLHLQLPHSTHR